MFTHNFDPILFDFGFIAIDGTHWLTFGILFGWYGKIIIAEKLQLIKSNFKIAYLMIL